MSALPATSYADPSKATVALAPTPYTRFADTSEQLKIPGKATPSTNEKLIELRVWRAQCLKYIRRAIITTSCNHTYKAQSNLCEPFRSTTWASALPAFARSKVDHKNGDTAVFCTVNQADIASQRVLAKLGYQSLWFELTDERAGYRFQHLGQAANESAPHFILAQFLAELGRGNALAQEEKSQNAKN